MYPSGAAQDRRVWLELKAFDSGNNLIFSSGNVGDTQDPEDINDPNLDCGDRSETQFALGLHHHSDDGTPAHFFWEVASETSQLLRPGRHERRVRPAFDHSTTARITLPVTSPFAQIDHMTARIRTRPFTYAALDDLVSSGDLDPMYARARSPRSIPSGAILTWSKAKSQVAGDRLQPLSR